MTDDELDNETFVGQKLCKDVHDDHDHDEGFNVEKEKIDDIKVQELAAQCADAKAKHSLHNKKLRVIDKFTRTRIGYTWPTTNFTKIEEQLKLNIISNSKGIAKMKPPKIKVAPISSNGTIDLTFTHKMLSPTGRVPPHIYNSVFRVSIRSKQDLSIFHGDFTTYTPPKNQTNSTSPAKTKR